MKTILLVAGVRGGSDFFQHLLDQHEEILTLPGSLRIDNEFKNWIAIKDYRKISKEFLKMYPEHFDSRLNKFERLDKLGKKRNRFFKVNKNKFLKNFNNLNKDLKNLDRFTILKNIHIAYAQAKGENIKKKKILFIHPHLVSWTRNLLNLVHFKNFVILHIIRHPLSCLSSAVKNWLRFKKGFAFMPKDLYFELDLMFNGIYDLMKLGKVYIIKYENIHKKSLKTMKGFCKLFKIKFNSSLLKPTLFGLKWWGDKVSNKWLNGINKNYEISFDKNIFFDRDVSYLQNINQNIFQKYNYSYFSKKKNISFNFFPLKMEILVFLNSIKHFYRWKHFPSSLYFFFKRILIFNLLNHRTVKLPKSIGD